MESDGTSSIWYRTGDSFIVERDDMNSDICKVIDPIYYVEKTIHLDHVSIIESF